MELRNFINESQSVVRKDCASLINRCDNYMLLHPQAKLWLRDTDHRFNPIRLESENVPFEDYTELISICSKCGSNIHVDYDNNVYDDYGLCFCQYCQSLVCGDGWTKLKKLLTYLDRIDLDKENNVEKNYEKHFGYSNKADITDKIITVKPNVFAMRNSEYALRLRIRVLTKEKQLLYLTLNRIRMYGENSLYIVHEKDKSDKVQFAGVCLFGRDKNGERLFQGDIVRFDIKHPDGRILTWEGVLANVKHNNDSVLYIVEDNLYNNFPPSPDWIDNNTIEVIGNLFEDPEYKIMGGDEAKYFATLINGVDSHWYDK